MRYCILILVLGMYSSTAFAQNKEANEAIYMAERYFRADSFKLALKGRYFGATSEFMGFLDIMDKYKGTKIANLAHFYAGICWLQLGDFDEALLLLEEYKPKGEEDKAMRLGLIGDVYSEQGQYKDALEQYERASSNSDNPVMKAYYLYKAALLLEIKFKAPKKAAKYYLTIKKEYPLFAEQRKIDRDLIRVGVEN